MAKGTTEAVKASHTEHARNRRNKARPSLGDGDHVAKLWALRYIVHNKIVGDEDIGQRKLHRLMKALSIELRVNEFGEISIEERVALRRNLERELRALERNVDSIKVAEPLRSNASMIAKMLSLSSLDQAILRVS